VSALLAPAPPPHHKAARRFPRSRVVAGALAVVVAVALILTAGAAYAAPVPAPSPSATAAGADCAAKAPGHVAWCMPWAVHVATPPSGAKSHWVTDCSKATDDKDRQSCWAASVSLAYNPKAGTPSVLGDGPSTNGLKALVNCNLLFDAGSNGQQSPWTPKHDACLSQAASWAAQSYDPRPTVDCGTIDVPCQVSKSAQEGIRSGVEGLIDLCVQGVVFLLSKIAEWVFSTTAIAAPDQAFYFTYNSVAGVLILLIFIFFILSTIINGLRVNAGPGPLSTLGGLVRAILGVTFAGGIAYTIVAAWDQATNSLLEHNAATPFDGRQWGNAFTALAGDTSTTFVAFVLSIMALLGLLPLFVMMLFRGILATGAALFGAWAMAGQAMNETRHWGRRWFWTVNALASSKFAIAALWVYGSRAAHESDLWTGLKAVLLIWLMLFCPYILLRLTAMVDGYLSDVNAHGLIASANPVGLGGSFMDGWNANSPSGDGDGGSGGEGQGPGSGAASVMSANSAVMPTTPDNPLGEAAGTDDGPDTEAADAAATGADGGKVGDPSATTGTDSTSGTDGEQGDSGVGQPNADEAEGVGQGLRSARHDVAAGELTAPGDTSGAGGSTPVVPQQGETPANPATGGAPPDSDTAGSSGGPAPGAGETGTSPPAEGAGKPAAAGESGSGAGGASAAGDAAIVAL
jgi:hypothetical protein